VKHVDVCACVCLNGSVSEVHILSVVKKTLMPSIGGKKKTKFQ
jgi:hypothetical protein